MDDLPNRPAEKTSLSGSSAGADTNPPGGRKSLFARLCAFSGGSAWLVFIYLGAAVMLGIYITPMIQKGAALFLAVGREIVPWSFADIVARILAIILGFCGIGAVAWYRNQTVARLAQYEKEQIRQAEQERAQKRNK